MPRARKAADPQTISQAIGVIDEFEQTLKTVEQVLLDVPEQRQEVLGRLWVLHDHLEQTLSRLVQRRE